MRHLVSYVIYKCYQKHTWQVIRPIMYAFAEVIKAIMYSSAKVQIRLPTVALKPERVISAKGCCTWIGVLLLSLSDGLTCNILCNFQKVWWLMKPVLTGSVLCNEPLKLQESGMDENLCFFQCEGPCLVYIFMECHHLSRQYDM